MEARGRSDGRTLIFVPEVKGSETTGITLLHVRFADRLPVAAARGVLDGYGRYAALVDAVTETEPNFRDDLLGTIDMVDLLTEAMTRLADRWRS
jgi:glucosamine--fructose-6-phosphate aminotransferase (isomerizing)